MEASQTLGVEQVTDSLSISVGFLAVAITLLVNWLFRDKKHERQRPRGLLGLDGLKETKTEV